MAAAASGQDAASTAAEAMVVPGCETDAAGWLGSCGLSELSELLLSEGLQLADIPHTTAAELRAVGINPPPPRPSVSSGDNDAELAARFLDSARKLVDTPALPAARVPAPEPPPLPLPAVEEPMAQIIGEHPDHSYMRICDV